MAKLGERARAMRGAPTDAERRLWALVRRHAIGGYKFRRQVVLGPYIVDFMCREGRLVVEVDGSQHADQVAYDARRDAYLRSEGSGCCGFRIGKCCWSLRASRR